MVELGTATITLLLKILYESGVLSKAQLERLRSPRRVIESRQEYLDDMRKHIHEESPENVYFLEYSSQRAQPAIQYALEHGCDVYLLLRHPHRDLKWRVSENQSNVILRELDNMSQFYYDLASDEARLYVQFYYRSAGLRARRVGDDWLYVGWYTFDNREGTNPGDKRVHGDNNPTIKLRRGTAGFEYMNSFFEDSFHSLWREGTNLSELVTNDTLHHREKDWASALYREKRSVFIDETICNHTSLFDDVRRSSGDDGGWELFRRNDAVPREIGEEIGIGKDTPVTWTHDGSSATVVRKSP